MKKTLKALRSVLQRNRAEHELDDELRFHVERRTEELVREATQHGAKLTADEARRRALVELGGPEQIKEEVRAMRTGIWFETLWQDVRYAARQLRKNPGFTVVAVLTLALGIGANTAVFSLLDTVLLKQLPVREPDRLVLFDWIAGPKANMIHSINGTFGTNDAGQGWSTSFSAPIFEEFRRNSGVFESVFAYSELDRLNAQIAGEGEIVYGQIVSGNYYSGLGVTAQAGRLLREEDDRAAAEPAAVISYRFWQRRFGGDRGAIGKAIYLNGSPFTIVGVAAQQFQGALQVGDSPEVTLPLAFDERLQTEKGRLTDETNWWVRIMGRLKPGVTREAALVQMKPAFHRMVTRNIPADAKWDVPELRIHAGGQGQWEQRREYANTLYLLLGGVGLVLLVACANVAMLMLMRSETRRKEVSVRMALGAQRARLMRQVLVESTVLSLLGGGAGWLLAAWSSQAVVAALPLAPGAMGPEPVLDQRVLLFTVAASLATGLLFGLAPALRWSHGDVSQAIKGAAEGGMRRSFLLGKSLIVVQVALSVVLLVGAGLLGRSLLKLYEVQFGFDASNVLLGRVDPTLNGYQEKRLADFYTSALDRLRALPAVESAGLVRAPLVGGRSWITSSVTIPGYEPAPGKRTYFLANLASDGFFETMRVPLLAGRMFTAQDNEHAALVAIINPTMARQYFRDANPVGRHFKNGKQEIQVIGVIADITFVDLRQGVQPTFVVPYRQHLSFLSAVHFAVRMRGTPQQTAASVREALRGLDPNLPLFEVMSQEQKIDASLQSERRMANLAGLFGGLALLLVCVGLAGLLSYEVSRRTREIGIRMALGGQPGAVRGMVLGRGLLLTALGLAAGLVAAIPLTRYLESVEDLLFGVKAFDLATFAATAVVLLAAAAAASWIPAQRATRVDPIVTLRHE